MGVSAGEAAGFAAELADDECDELAALLLALEGDDCVVDDDKNDDVGGDGADDDDDDDDSTTDTHNNEDDDVALAVVDATAPYTVTPPISIEPHAYPSYSELLLS